MLLPDGSLFKGDFGSDRIEGRGTYEYGGGRGCHVGEWRAGRKHGKARKHLLLTGLACPDGVPLVERLMEPHFEFARHVFGAYLGPYFGQSKGSQQCWLGRGTC